MIYLDGRSLTLPNVISVACDDELVALSPSGEEQIVASRKIVDKILAEEKPVYGVSTGFGDFSTVFIKKEQRSQLQRNLILSHATGLVSIYRVK